MFKFFLYHLGIKCVYPEPKVGMVFECKIYGQSEERFVIEQISNCGKKVKFKYTHLKGEDVTELDVTMDLCWWYVCDTYKLVEEAE